MKDCCFNWIYSAAPATKEHGVFEEIQACPTCGIKYRIKFEEIRTLGDDGNSRYVVVGVTRI